MGSYVSSFLESLSSSYESLFGSSAQPAAAPSMSQAKSSHFWDNYSKEELKQLGLTRRYLFMQEEHLRTVAPALAKEMWLIIGDANSHLPPLPYPTGSPLEAVERAYANPVQYLAKIPSANALAKTLYDQAKVADHRNQNGQKISRDEALGILKVKYASQYASQRIRQEGLNRGAKMQAKVYQAVATRNPVFAQEQVIQALAARSPTFASLLGKSPEAIAAGKKRLVAEITVRLKSLYSEGGRWPHLEAEYRKLRDGIHLALGGVTQRYELENKPFGLNSSQAPSLERPRHELFSLLLIIERNWKIVLGLLMEVRGLMEVAENPQPLIGWDYLRALGPNKIAKQTLEQAFAPGPDFRHAFSWLAVKMELGI